MAADDPAIEEAFHAARVRPPAERAAFLREACGGDAERLTMVESLLASCDAATGFLETPAAELLAGGKRAVDQGARLGATIGNYRILRVIGTGGMGVVYEAEQSAPRRTVALKLLRRALFSQAAVQRFQREAELLGRLRHEGIAPVFEAGVHDEGGDPTPYFAMELLGGAVPLTEYAWSHSLSVPERAALFRKVCRAVQYCHNQGVVHRDLKPGNILVTPAGRPKIIDFGVAQAQAASHSPGSWQTTGHPLLGSLAYMSPEQVCGDAGAVVDAQSDVFALGVIAYELFAGRLPLELGEAPPLEAARIIRDKNPPALGALDRQLRGDLETIVATAMAKDKALRYPSAEALAQDLERFQQRQPINARPPTRRYLVLMFARRHRALCALGTATAAILMVATALSTLFALRAERQRGIARQAEALAITQREAADYQAYIANIAAADAALRIHDVADATRRLERAPERFRNWEWRYLQGQLDHSIRTLQGHNGIVAAVAFSPDGQWLATGTGGWSYHDPIVRVWDVATGGLVHTLEGHGDGIGSVAFHPQDPYRLATGSNDDTARVWDLRSGDTLAVLPHPRNVGHVFFGNDGTSLITLDDTGLIHVWDVRGAALQATFGDPSRRECHCATLLPARRTLVCGGWDGVVRAFDVPSGDLLATMTGHTASIVGVAASRDGAWIASASEDSTIRVWRSDGWAEWITLRGHLAAVWNVAFAPGPQTLLASISIDNTVRLWRLGDPTRPPSAEPVAVLHGHAAMPASIAFSPDGLLMATGAADKTAKLWTVAKSSQPTVLSGHAQMVRTLAFSPDGRWIASGAFDHSIRVWDVARRTLIATLDSQTERTQTVAFHPHGTHLAAAGGGVVRIWETQGLSEVAALEADRYASHAMAFSPDGKLLASAGRDAVIKVWDAQAYQLLRSIDLESRWIETLVFVSRPAATWLLAGSSDGTIQVLDLESGARLRAFNPGAGGVMMLAISPNGAIGASAHLDGTIRLWDVTTGAELGRLIGHTALVNAVAFSPDGSRLASAANDTTVRVWDATSHEGLTTLRSHEHWVLGVAFSPDGTRIVSGGGSYDGSDCALRLWEAPGPRQSNGP